MLVTGIVAAIAISAAAAAQSEGSPGAAGWTNLPPSQLVVYLSTAGQTPAVVPQLTAAQLTHDQARVSQEAADLHSVRVLPLYAAVGAGAHAFPEGGTNGFLTTTLASPVTGPGGKPGLLAVAQLYVATPAVLQFYGLSGGAIRPGTDVVTSRSGLSGMRILDFGSAGLLCKAVDGSCPASPHHGGGSAAHPTTRATTKPTIQELGLPRYTSAPNALLTAHAMTRLHLQPMLAAWLIQMPKALTATQITHADHWAAASGLTVETTDHSPQASLAGVSDDALAVGALAVLAVLAMTVGLIRSETAGDLRVLAATGATANTRRLLTGVTAATLALLGAVLGAAAAYLGIIAWNRGVHTLAHVPILKLAALTIGLPLLALVAGWLLAGREPDAMARQPLD
jgi:putative ABC transport system permease protein